MNTAIIVAAGSGHRFAGSQPKQFAELCGKPLIIHSLERFDACNVVDEIVLVLSADGKRQFEVSSFGYEITKLRSIVTGGATRAESVRNGLDSVDANTANIIAVHDGARPLVSVDEIERTISKADETGAACLVAEVTDTIKEVSGGHISGTINRSKLRRALTPQAFRYDIIKSAFDGVSLDESVTDECYLVEKLDIEIAFVEGSGLNLKITRREDMLFAKSVIEAGSYCEMNEN